MANYVDLPFLGLTLNEFLYYLGYFEPLVEQTSPGVFEILFDNYGNMLFEVTL